MNKKLCVVVGVGPGVGLAVARRFGREGFLLALIARRAEVIAAYVDDLGKEGIEAHAFAADAGDTAALIQAFVQIKAEIGTPDVVVYNAAAMTPDKPAELNPDRVAADFRVNVVGALVCAQQVIPSMRTQQRGTILVTGGGLALSPETEYASLAIGKAGLRNLCYSLGAELEPDGIHVATVTICGFVSPGTHFDPDLIAERYWHLHTQQWGDWEREIVYE